MKKRDEILAERRRFIRLPVPLGLTYACVDTGKVCVTLTKNISADGLRYETVDRDLAVGAMIELKIEIPGAGNPVHAKARIVWKKKLSLEDAAPYDIGAEFAEIEDDNKNTFLTFMCNLIYNIPRENRYVGR